MSLKKGIFFALAVLLVAGIVIGTVLHSRANVAAVTTARVQREDLTATISGTGQVKPKTYVNVGATSFGRITHLYVKEGDHVRQGAILATVENVQPTATVAAQQATIDSSRTDVSSNQAAEGTASANVAEAKADLEQKQLDYGRAQQLYDGKLIARQDFDSKKPPMTCRSPRCRNGRPRSHNQGHRLPLPAVTSLRPWPRSAPTTTRSTKPSAELPSTAW